MKKSVQAKKPSESSIEMRQLVMPIDINPNNTIFGGVVMSWVDKAAAMAATRHTHRPVATVHVSDMSFKAPIRVGDHVLIQAMVNYTGKTSLEVGVKVIAENPITGERWHTTSAYLVFVSFDQFGKPTEVPPLIIESDDEKRRYANAQKRIEFAKSMRKA